MTVSADEDFVKSFHPPADRIIAIGDVHGDILALKSCLKIAGLLDSDDNWAGGKTHLVQVRCKAEEQFNSKSL